MTQPRPIAAAKPDRYDADERAAIQAEAKPRPTIPGVQLMEAPAIWAELLPPRYVVDGLFTSGSLALLNAYGGSGKSWLAVDLAVAVAAGESWLHRFPTEQGGSLYLDYEAGTYEMRRRFQAVTGARNIRGPVSGVTLASHPSLHMGGGRKVEGQLIQLMDGKRLLIVDTWKAANPGTDENDSNIRVGLDMLHRVAERCDAAVVVLTHSKKTSGNPLQIDAREAGRGSSAIFDAADTVLHVAYQKGKPLRVSQTKGRLGRQADTFLAHIDDVPGGVHVWAEDAPPEQDSADDFDSVCSTVLELVRTYPGESGRVYRSRAGVAPAKVVAALEWLDDKGEIRNTGTATRPKWFAREL